MYVVFKLIAVFIPRIPSVFNMIVFPCRIGACFICADVMYRHAPLLLKSLGICLSFKEVILCFIFLFVFFSLIHLPSFLVSWFYLFYFCFPVSPFFLSFPFLFFPFCTPNFMHLLFFRPLSVHFGSMSVRRRML